MQEIGVASASVYSIPVARLPLAVPEIVMMMSSALTMISPQAAAGTHSPSRLCSCLSATWCC